MKKIFLQPLFLMPTLVLPTVLVSCGETNRFYLAQKDLKSFLNKIEEDKINFQEYKNEKAISEIKYIKYLLNSSNDKDKYSINYFRNRLELKLFVPFLESYKETDITKTSLGRMLKIAHGNHFHTRFVTWDEFPPTKQEEKLFNKKGYIYVFENVDSQGKINWQKIKLKNDFLKSDNFPKLIDLSKNNSKKSSSQKGIGTSKYKLKKEFIDTLTKEFPEEKENIEAFSKKDYVDKSVENESWQYNADHENLLLSDAALNLGVDLIKTFSKSKKLNINFGFDEKQIKSDLLNWWFVNKPNSHEYEHEDGSKQKDEVISGLMDLSEEQLDKLNKVDLGNKEYEVFLNSLEETKRKLFLENIDKYGSPRPTGNYNFSNMNIYYFKDKNGHKKYVDNIFVLVRGLYDDFIKLKEKKPKDKSYYSLEKDDREIKNGFFSKRNNSSINLNFSINLEKAFNWKEQTPLYYFSRNEKIFKSQKDLDKFLN